MSSKTYNILVTGASGLLGRVVYKYLSDSSYQAKYPLNQNENYVNSFKWNCLGLCYSRARDSLKPLDLNNTEEVDELIADFKVIRF
jgi:nucleoside-diphosphate-sugar epimerase